MSHSNHQSPNKPATLIDTSTSPKGNRFFLNKTYIGGLNPQSTKSGTKKNDLSIQLPDLEGARKEMTSITKLPPVTDLINIRATHLDPEVNKVIVDLTKYAQNLEHIIRSKDKEIERLEYINKYLTLTQQSRETLLTQTLEENRKLKEMSYLVEKRTPEKKLQVKKSASPSIPMSNSASKKQLSQLTNVKHAAIYPDELRIASANTSEVRSPLLGKNKPHHSRSRDEKKNQSILQMNEEEVNTLYAENDSFAFLEDILRTEDGFMQQVHDFSSDKLFKLYEAIQTVKEDHLTLRDMIFKLRRIVKATITMTTSLVLDEAIERIIDETCECLDCDRASTFIYDSTREELWSKKAKGSDESIRVPVNKGIVGHVFTKGEALNIHNAYVDERFNKSVDLKTGYKTTTMLTVPIKDDNSVIGVVQAVNKKGMNAIFTKDDEALLTILSNLAGVVLRNSMTYNQQLSFHNVLRSALKSGVYLNSLHDLSQLLPSAEKKLKSLMGIERAQIVLKHPNKNELFSISSDGTKQTYTPNCGIIGQVIMTGEYENITNGYGHPLFNGLIDIETSMPLLCVPMNHPSTDKVMGAIEIINTKGIQGLSALQRANVDALDKETLEFFSRQLAQAVLNCYEWERLQGQSKGGYSLFEGDADHLLTKENLDKLNLAGAPKYTISKASEDSDPEDSSR